VNQSPESTSRIRGPAQRDPGVRFTLGNDEKPMRRELRMKFGLVLASLLACALMQVGCGEPQWTENGPIAPAATAKPHVSSTAFAYVNPKYGFCFALPISWKGYTIVTEQWRGLILSSGHVVNGPQLVIRNPQWTQATPYQDIPIMVFTPAQWKQVDNVEMSVSAAPIGPSKLGQTSRYVFALPPRWIGFTDAAGTQDLESWMQQNRLRAPCGISKPQPSTQPAAPQPAHQPSN
jgi:hypothetical protein